MLLQFMAVFILLPKCRRQRLG